MKNIIKLGCLFLLAVTVSCSSAKPTVTESSIQTKIITETVHDTIFEIEKDSSYYQAYLDCQDGKVVIKEVTQAEPGRKLKSPKVRIVNNQLKIDCMAMAEAKFAFWKSQQVADIQYKTIFKTEYTNKLTWWQNTQIYGFRLLAIIILLLLGWLIYKLKI